MCIHTDRVALSDAYLYASDMRRGISAICLAVALGSAGCPDEWDLKWPELNMPKAGEKVSISADQPTDTGPPLSPNEQLVKLQNQVRALRQQLEVAEKENAIYRKSDHGTEELRKQLEEQKFIVKMQAEDIKVLRMAAVERDTYKVRLDRMEKENRSLNARILTLMKRLAALERSSSGGTGPTTRPAGT